MANNSDPVEIHWCILWTKSVYLYGHIIPAIALFIFGITFNPIALYYFSKSRNFRRSAYSYYFSAIAVVDYVRLILWGLFLILDYKIFRLKFHSFECPTQIYGESVASSISAWLTVSLTVERCLVIYRPLQTLTETRGKRALIVIISVICVSCLVNSLFLQPGFYDQRDYVEHLQTIVCFYEQTSSGNSTNRAFLTPHRKQIYTIFIVFIRVAIPFVLLFTANIVLFVSVGQQRKATLKSGRILLVRHGQHRQVTPMIFFSSCILLLTISPRYLVQFYVNLFDSYDNCSLFHFVPHLLKTLELFNYSFNVFISIVSGKHGRHELFDMLFCRSASLRSSWTHAATQQSSVLIRYQNHSRSNHKTDEPIDPTHKTLLPNDR